MPTATGIRLTDIHFQVSTDSPLNLPVAAFDEDWNILGFQFLDIPSGGRNLCLQDLDLSDDMDFLEFQVPPELFGNVWFNAIADEPDLEYKDQLSNLAIPQPSRVGELIRVIEVWSGNDGMSYLGNSLDILDIVDFLNNRLLCP